MRFDIRTVVFAMLISNHVFPFLIKVQQTQKGCIYNFINYKLHPVHSICVVLGSDIYVVQRQDGLPFP